MQDTERTSMVVAGAREAIWIRSLLLALLVICSKAHGETWFGAPLITPIPNTPWSLRAAHLNADTLMDIVVGVGNDMTGPDEAELYMNAGGGAIVLGQTIPSNSSYTKVEVGDWNGDGRTDICVSGYPPRVWYADLDHGYPGPGIPIYPTPGDHAISPSVAADVDDDGFDDLVCCRESDASRAFVLFGSQTGISTPSATLPVALPHDYCGLTYVNQLAIADMDDDGRADIVLTAWLDDFSGCGYEAGIGWFRNLGNRIFDTSTQWILVAPDLRTEISMGHVNHDLYPDFVISDASLNKRVYLSTGLGSWSVGPIFANQHGRAELCDGDADGELDLVIPDYQRTVVYRGVGAGLFTPVDTAMVAGPYCDLACVDLTGDGRPDLASHTRYSNYAVWILPGATGPSSGVGGPGPDSPRLIVCPTVTHGQPVSILGSSGLAVAGARAGEAFGIWDVRGRRVNTLSPPATGDRWIVWDLRDNHERPVSSGTYWIGSVAAASGRARVVVLR